MTIALEPLILLLAGWSSGISVYLSVALLGLSGRMGWIALPGELSTVSNPILIGAAFLLFLVEFVADKVPYFDSVWDSVHTFIRPVGGVALGYMAGSEHGPLLQSLYALFTGTLALQTHTAKAATRLAINTSPEPFSNIAASTAEQSLVVFMFWFFIQHPIWTAVILVALIVLSFFLMRALWRFVKKLFTRQPKPI